MLKYFNAVLIIVALGLSAQFYREMTAINAEDFQSEVEVSEPIVVNQPTSVEGEVLEPDSDPIAREGESMIGDLPAKFNLDMDFHPQAPFGDWGEPYQEACEESSLLLAYHYVNGISVTREEFDEELLAMVAWEEANLGKYKDTSLDEVARIASEYLGHFNYEIVDNPTAEQLKSFVAQGFPVVAPMSGQDLGNPFFTGDGPVFHALVIRGYEEDGFITNDVGTQHGENFFYEENLFMNAIFDWDDSMVKTRESMRTGLKRVLVVKP